MQLQNSTYQNNLTEIRMLGRSLFQPRVKKSVSEFAAEKRYVSREESARPGQWDNTIVPFAVEPMNSFSDREVEHITFMGSSQVVKTEILKNCIAYIIDQDPAPTLIIYPTDGDARDFSTEKLEPMIEANKYLRENVAPAKSNSKDNKTLYKKFLGGFCAITGARVAQELARRSVKYVFADDRDRIGIAGTEGDAVELAWQRTESYALLGRKICEFSTPTVEGASAIKASYLLSDRRQYHVPCPECGEMQTLKFENLVWEKETDLLGKVLKHFPETAAYKCDYCGELIDESSKMYMLSNGRWIAERPEVIKHRGFWINRLYSTFSTWKDIVEYFLRVKDDRAKLQVFYNTVLAKTWKLDQSEDLDETGLINRCGDYMQGDDPRVPNEVLVLVAAVDVQPDRLEYLIAGAGLQGEPYHIEYDKLYGDPDQDDIWNDLDERLSKTFKREDGLPLSITFRAGIDFPVFVDSGGTGGNTQSVYRQTRKRFGRGFIATKGVAGSDKPMLLNISKVGPMRNILLQRLGIDNTKTLIMKMLRVNTSPNKIHFHRGCDGNYFEQLTSERRITEIDKKNFKKYTWKKKSAHARNEVLDLWVLALSALRKLDPNYAVIDKRFKSKLEAMKEAKQEDKTVTKKEPVKLRRRSGARRRAG